MNEDGNVIMDKFVAPTERVTDYRTAVSGVRPGIGGERRAIL